jgi:transposase-like protein
MIGGKCTVRACPFNAAEGSLICGYHQNFFSYESDLYDRSVDTRYRDEAQFTPDGLVIRVRRKSQLTREDRISAMYHQILGSAGMLADALKYLREAPNSQILDWSSNHFAAQELLELSRYPDRQIVCPYCGWRDIARYHRGFNVTYLCRLCARQWSLTARTILHHHGLTLDKWVHALRILKENYHRGVMSELTERLKISPMAALRLNHKFRLCGETLGLELGWTGLTNSPVREAVRQKLGLPAGTGPGSSPAALMTIIEVASHFNCKVARVREWVRRERIKCVRFRKWQLSVAI